MPVKVYWLTDVNCQETQESRMHLSVFPLSDKTDVSSVSEFERVKINYRIKCLPQYRSHHKEENI